jgi:hypothetical protein
MDEYDANSFEHRRDIGRSLSKGDDLSAVLRFHVHIEQALNMVILQSIPNSTILLNAIGFVRKVRIAEKLHLIDIATRKCLNNFSTLRDEFAHRLKTRTFTAQNDAALPKTLPPDAYQQFLNGVGFLSEVEPEFSKSVGFASRIFMYSLYQHIVDLYKASSSVEEFDSTS